MGRIIRIINLPAAVKGVTIPDEDGDYNIYINAKMSFEMQKQAYEHESGHIDNHDFSSDQPVLLLEAAVRYSTRKQA